MKLDTKTQNFLETTDPQLLNNIMKLYQKLKGLSAEIQVNLENPFVIEEQYRDEYKKQLAILSESVDVGINGLDEMLNFIASQDEETNKEFLASEIMQTFRKNIEIQLLEIQNKKLEL